MIKKNTKIHIIIKTFSYKLIYHYILFICLLFKSKKISFNILPIKLKKLTLLRSPHKYKKAQEHFHLKIYKIQLITENLFFSNLLILLLNKSKGLKFQILINEILI